MFYFLLSYENEQYWGECPSVHWPAVCNLFFPPGSNSQLHPAPYDIGVPRGWPLPLPKKNLGHHPKGTLSQNFFPLS